MFLLCIRRVTYNKGRGSRKYVSNIFNNSSRSEVNKFVVPRELSRVNLSKKYIYI